MPIQSAGGTQFISFGAMSALDAFSFSVWILLTALNTDSKFIFTTQTSDAGNGIAIIIRANNHWPTFNSGGISGPNFISATTPVTPASGWVHFAGTKLAGGGRARIYVNGVDENNQNQTQPNAAFFNSPAMSTFNTTSSFAFPGLIDEFAMWDTVLTQEDVTRLFLGGKFTPLDVRFGNLVFYTPLDDGIDGTSVNNHIVRELINSNNGTGDWGSDATGLDWKAEEILSYPGGVIFVRTEGGVVPVPVSLFSHKLRFGTQESSRFGLR